MDKTHSRLARLFPILLFPLVVLVAVPLAAFLAILFYLMTFVAVIQTLLDTHLRWLPALAGSPKEQPAAGKMAPAVRA